MLLLGIRMSTRRWSSTFSVITPPPPASLAMRLLFFYHLHHSSAGKMYTCTTTATTATTTTILSRYVEFVTRMLSFSVRDVCRVHARLSSIVEFCLRVPVYICFCVRVCACAYVCVCMRVCAQLFHISRRVIGVECTHLLHVCLRFLLKWDGANGIE